MQPLLRSEGFAPSAMNTWQGSSYPAPTRTRARPTAAALTAPSTMQAAMS